MGGTATELAFAISAQVAAHGIALNTTPDHVLPIKTEQSGTAAARPAISLASAS